jgi:hypothetical protein
LRPPVFGEGAATARQQQILFFGGAPSAASPSASPSARPKWVA